MAHSIMMQAVRQIWRLRQTRIMLLYCRAPLQLSSQLFCIYKPRKGSNSTKRFLLTTYTRMWKGRRSTSQRNTDSCLNPEQLCPGAPSREESFYATVLICNESAQCLEGDNMIAMTIHSVKAVVLIGDSKQLPLTVISQNTCVRMYRHPLPRLQPRQDAHGIDTHLLEFTIPV